MKIKTMKDILSHTGGTIQIAAAVDVSQNTVERWKHHGIPQKYWARIQEKFGIAPLDIYAANEALKK
jgi:hypothetical protein